MDDKKKQLKKKETLFIDLFGYSPSGSPFKSHQMLSIPILNKELEGKLYENFEIKEEAEQINSIPKTIEDCKENVSNE